MSIEVFSLFVEYSTYLTWIASSLKTAPRNNGGREIASFFVMTATTKLLRRLRFFA
jgi:hypothetical protein